MAFGQVRNPQLMGALCGSILAAIEDLGPQNVGVLVNLSGLERKHGMVLPNKHPQKKQTNTNN